MYVTKRHFLYKIYHNLTALSMRCHIDLMIDNLMLLLIRSYCMKAILSGSTYLTYKAKSRLKRWPFELSFEMHPITLFSGRSFGFYKKNNTPKESLLGLLRGILRPPQEGAYFMPYSGRNKYYLHQIGIKFSALPAI